MHSILPCLVTLFLISPYLIASCSTSLFLVSPCLIASCLTSLFLLSPFSIAFCSNSQFLLSPFLIPDCSIWLFLTLPFSILTCTISLFLTLPWSISSCSFWQFLILSFLISCADSKSLLSAMPVFTFSSATLSFCTLSEARLLSLQQDFSLLLIPSSAFFCSSASLFSSRFLALYFITLSLVCFLIFSRPSTFWCFCHPHI